MEGLLGVLPNLSVPVIAIGALVFIALKFLEVLEKRAQMHEASMKEREDALRKVEKDIRGELIGILGRSNDAIAASNSAIGQNTKVMERVIGHLDKH